MFFHRSFRSSLCQTETLVSRISNRRPTWLGHVVRMEDRRLPAKALYSYVDGKWSWGRQPKTWKGKQDTRPSMPKKTWTWEQPWRIDYYQRQRGVEPSCKNLIVGRKILVLTKERKRGRKKTIVIAMCGYCSVCILMGYANYSQWDV